jgi:nitroreductase
LEAAVRAPTAIHQEPWGFVVIQDKQLLQRLSNQTKPVFLAEVRQHATEHSKHLLETFDKPDFNIFYDAGTLILICGRTSASFYTADCWLAAENLMLAACAMDLGTCVIGSALTVLNMPEVKDVLKISKDFSVVAPIILGYPHEKTAPTSRKFPVILASYPSIGIN